MKAAAAAAFTAWLGPTPQNTAADSVLVLHQQWGDQDNYEVVRKVGRGKYSEVFEVRACHPGSCLAAATAACTIAPSRHQAVHSSFCSHRWL